MGRCLPLGRCIELGKLDIGRPFKIPSISRWQMLLVSELILTVFSDLLKSMDLIPEIRMYQSGNRFFYSIFMFIHVANVSSSYLPSSISRIFFLACPFCSDATPSSQSKHIQSACSDGIFESFFSSFPGTYLCSKQSAYTI